MGAGGASVKSMVFCNCADPDLVHLDQKLVAHEAGLEWLASSMLMGAGDWRVALGAKRWRKAPFENFGGFEGCRRLISNSIHIY